MRRYIGQDRTSNNCRKISKGITHIIGIPEEKENGAEGIFGVVMTDNFPKLVTYTRA